MVLRQKARVGLPPNFYSSNRYLLISSVNKVCWEIQRFGELVGGTYNVVEETER